MFGIRCLPSQRPEKAHSECNCSVREQSVSLLYPGWLRFRAEWCPGADYANSINSMTYAKVGQSIFPHGHYAFRRECPTVSALPSFISAEAQSLDLTELARLARAILTNTQQTPRGV